MPLEDGPAIAINLILSISALIFNPNSANMLLCLVSHRFTNSFDFPSSINWFICHIEDDLVILPHSLASRKALVNVLASSNSGIWPLHSDLGYWIIIPG